MRISRFCAGKYMGGSCFRTLVEQIMYSSNLTGDETYFHQAIISGWVSNLATCVTFIPPSQVPPEADKNVSNSLSNDSM